MTQKGKEMEDLDELVQSILRNLDVEIPSCTLPEPDMVSYWKLVQDRKFYLDYCIDSNVMGLQRAIFLINVKDKDVPVAERKPIYIYIMSTGGSLEYMYTLIDAIQLSKTPVYTVNVGIAASAAGLIFMSGHKRFMMPMSKILIHEGSAELEGDAGKVMDAVDSYKKDLKHMKEFILSRTEIPKNLLNKKRPNDWTLDANECLNFKVCDRIIESLDEVM